MIAKEMKQKREMRQQQLRDLSKGRVPQDIKNNSACNWNQLQNDYKMRKQTIGMTHSTYHKWVTKNVLTHADQSNIQTHTFVPRNQRASMSNPPKSKLQSPCNMNGMNYMAMLNQSRVNTNNLIVPVNKTASRQGSRNVQSRPRVQLNQDQWARNSFATENSQKRNSIKRTLSKNKEPEIVTTKLADYDWDADEDMVMDDALENTMKKIQSNKVNSGILKEMELSKKMLSGFAELGNYYLDNEMSINFHKDFRDLNPHYLKLRHQRAVKCANLWLGQIGDKLKDRVSVEARKNFNQYISEGNKLTLAQLRQLNPQWKDDYIHHQILEDEVVQEMLRECQERIDQEYDDLYQARKDIRDTTDELPMHIKQVNQNIKNRAEKLGLSKKAFKTGFFKEFNIMDMVAYDGKICSTCYAGKKCLKHPLGKRPQHMEEKEIYELFHKNKKKGKFKDQFVKGPKNLEATVGRQFLTDK